MVILQVVRQIVEPIVLTRVITLDICQLTSLQVRDYRNCWNPFNLLQQGSDFGTTRPWRLRFEGLTRFHGLVLKSNLNFKLIICTSK